MATLAQMRSRLDSARALHTVVTTMQAMAAVNLRQFERAAEAVAEYHRTIELGLQIVLRDRPVRSATGHRTPADPVSVVALGSDQGMTGSFNDAMAEFVDRRLDGRATGGPSEATNLLVVGVRCRRALVDRGLPVRRVLPAPGTPAAVITTVREILVTLDRWREARGADRVMVYHHVPTNGASYEPREAQLLPLDLEWLRELQRRSWSGRRVPCPLLAADELFAALVRSHLEASLFRMVARSAAAENASRLASMRSAERNIEEREDELTSAVRQRRQQLITEELLDIVAGFEALSSDRGGPEPS